MEVGRPGMSSDDLYNIAYTLGAYLCESYHSGLLNFHYHVVSEQKVRDTGLFQLIDGSKFAAACSHLVYSSLNIASGLSS